MSLTFDRRGSTWTVVDDHWEVMLIARDVYYGTERCVVTLTMAREIPGEERQKILTERLDLMGSQKRKHFATEGGTRLHQLGPKNTAEAYQAAMLTLIERFLEHLQTVNSSIESVSLTDIEIPDDMTPPYTVWPMVPSSRPGMLVSPSGSGKSTLAGAVGLSVVVGKAILPRLEPRIQGPVLYIGQEESKEQWAARITQLCKGHNIKPPSGYEYMKLANGSLVESAERVAERAKTIHAALVIVDSAQATWGAESESVRGWATQWFNSIDSLETPALVIDHPNRAETGKQNDSGFAAGSSVKRDRVGHSWSLKSLELPVKLMEPKRYHVTLKDTKRNYVARQDDIYYETHVKGYNWIRLVESGELSADVILEQMAPANLLEGIIAVMGADDSKDGEGWTTADLGGALHMKDDRRIREAMRVADWRESPKDPLSQFKFEVVEGTGSRGSPRKYVMRTRPLVSQVRMVLDDD